MAQTRLRAELAGHDENRDHRPKRRQEEVIAAAVRMFARSGYSGASVEDIANELGILKGSLYYYTASKEDLLYAIVLEVHTEVKELLAAATSDPEVPPLDRLASYVRAQVEYNALNTMKISVYYHDLDLLGADRLKGIRGSLQAIEGVVTDLIREAQDLGEIEASVDPVLASHAVFATVNWIYRWYKPRGRLGPSEIADFVVQYVLHGIVGARVPAPPQ